MTDTVIRVRGVPPIACPRETLGCADSPRLPTRRAVLRGLCGAAVASLASGCGVKAESPIELPTTIGLLRSGHAQETQRAGLQETLQQAERAPARGVRIVERHADFDRERLPKLAAQLAHGSVSALLCMDLEAALAMRVARQDESTPIVFVVHDDPLAKGLIDSYAHPGHNLTGITTYRCVDHKMIEVMKQAIPSARRIGYVGEFSTYEDSCRDLAELAARHNGVELVRINVVEGEPIEALFSRLAQSRLDGVVLPSTSPIFDAQAAVATGIARMALPAIYESSNFVRQGGLMSYSALPIDPVTTVAALLTRVLRRGAAGDIPVQQPLRFELAVNLQSAHARSMNLSRNLLARADRVIE